MLNKVCDKLFRKASGMVSAENIAGNQVKVEFWKGYRMALTELQCEMAAMDNVESKPDTPTNSTMPKLLCDTCRDAGNCWVSRLHIMKETDICPHYIKRSANSAVAHTL